MIDFSKYREDFPILKRRISDHDLIFFDNGATTQKPNQVIDAISNYYKNYNSNIHRSVYTLGNESEKIYEESKELVKKFINASSYEEVIYTSGTTESLIPCPLAICRFTLELKLFAPSAISACTVARQAIKSS